MIALVLTGPLPGRDPAMREATHATPPCPEIDPRAGRAMSGHDRKGMHR